VSARDAWNLIIVPQRDHSKTSYLSTTQSPQDQLVCITLHTITSPDSFTAPQKHLRTGGLHRARRKRATNRALFVADHNRLARARGVALGLAADDELAARSVGVGGRLGVPDVKLDGVVLFLDL